MRTLIPLITMLLLLTGCSTHTPPVREYTILPSSSPSPSQPRPLAATLLIAPVKTVPSLASKQIHYLRGDQETGSYLYARWSDTPPAMISRSLTLGLEERHLFSTVLSPASTLKADWLLESDLHSFYHRFDDEEHSAGVIDVTFRLIDTAAGRVVASKRLSLSVTAPTPDSAGGAAALSEATARMTSECIDWIQTTLQERQ